MSLPSNLDAKCRVVNLPVDAISPAEMNTRFSDTVAADVELIESIKACGILEPLRVRSDGAEHYVCQSGNRRLLAARALGLVFVPCIVADEALPDEVVIQHGNLGRSDPNAAEECLYYVRLIQERGLDVDGIAEKCGVPVRRVSARLELVDWPEELFEAVRTGQITYGVARELAKVKREDECLRLLSYALTGGLTVSQARRWRRGLDGLDDDADTDAYEAELERKREAVEGAPQWEICTLCGAHDKHPVFLRLCAGCSDQLCGDLLSKRQERDNTSLLPV